MELDPSIFPISSKFLNSLEHGLLSYPDCRTTADYSILVRNEYPELVMDKDLPMRIRQVLARPLQRGEWISEVVANLLICLARDRVFDSDEAFSAWTFDANCRLFSRPLYRALMFVCSPQMIVQGAAERWSHFHQGSSLSILKASPGHFCAQLTYRENTFAALNIMSMGDAYRAALACAGAHDIALETSQVTRSEARYEATWAVGENSQAAVRPVRERWAGTGLARSAGSRTLAQTNEVERSMAGGIAHAVRNPLAATQLLLHGLVDGQRGATPLDTIGHQAENLFRLCDEGLPPVAREASRKALVSLLDSALGMEESLRGAQRTTTRALQVVDAIVTYAHLQNERCGRSPVLMHEVVGEVLESFADELKSRTIGLVAEVGEATLRRGSANHMRLLVQHLLQNAVDACARTAHLRTPVIVIQLATVGGQVVLMVADNGPGIEGKSKDAMFAPFVTTEPSSRLGLGLAVVRKIAALQGGKVRGRTRSGDGATFAVILPIKKPSRRRSLVATKPPFES